MLALAIAHGGQILYFGSVRFFKHIILSIVSLLILGLIFAIIMLSISNNALQKQAEQLEQDKAALEQLVNFKQDSTTANFYELYKNYQINGEEFLALLFLDQPEVLHAFYGSREYQAANPPKEEETTPPVVTTTPKTEVTTPSVDLNYTSLYPDLFTQVDPPEQYNQDSGYVYLTFDDGPSVYTNDILSILNKYNIKATFFVSTLHSDSQVFRDRIKRIHDAGHTIGIHTHTHDYHEIYADVEAYLADFYTAYSLVYDAIGEKPTLFRFPGGSINDYNEETRDDIIAEMTRRGFIYYDWNVDSRDAFNASWTEMYHDVLNQTRQQDRSIILFHDRTGGLNTVYVLEDIILALLQDTQNYQFDKLTPQVRPIQF